jgi:hypothetical protein
LDLLTRAWADQLHNFLSAAAIDAHVSDATFIFARVTHQTNL